MSFDGTDDGAERWSIYAYPTNPANPPDGVLVGVGPDLRLAPACRFEAVPVNFGERAAGIPRPRPGPAP